MNVTDNLNLSAENQRKLKELVIAIKASDGIFSLLITVCDDLQLRERLIQAYEQKLQDRFRFYRTKLSHQQLSLRLALAELVNQNSSLQQGEKAVITVTGVEDLLFVRLKEGKSEIEQFFGYLQWTREGLREFHYPIILWITEQIFLDISAKAADFWSWRKGVFQFESQTPVNTNLFVPHEDFLLQFLNKEEFEDDLPLEDLEDLIAKTVAQRGEKAPLLATLYYRLGNLYLQRLRTGQFVHLREEQQKAINCLNKAIELQAELGLSLDLPVSLNTLAQVYEHMGKYKLAEPLYLQALQLYKHVLPTHPGTAISLNNLATLYRLQGRFREAEPLYLQALDLHNSLLGQDHKDVATSVNNLANVYHSQGRFEEAEPLYLQALELYKSLLGQDHPHVATSLNNLAELYRSQGRLEEAEPLYLQALELRKRLLGQDHPDIATSLNNLAELYRSQGRYSEAEPLYLQALELRKRLLGQDHPYVATSLNNLAELYRSQGQYSEAKPLYQQALEICDRTLGSNHPDTITVRENLANLRNQMGDK